MSGPLRRLCSSSDILEDDDSIPWTYISPQTEESDEEADAYTSKGMLKKRRRVNRKTTDKSEVKSKSDVDFKEWTEEEDYSLCHVVAMGLRKSSGTQTGPTPGNGHDLPHNPSSSETDPAEALLAKNMTKALQTMSISKVLAECFIPTHGYTDVVTRVKSASFRRKFIGFVQSRRRPSEGLVTKVKLEEPEAVSCDVGLSSDNDSKDGSVLDRVQQEVKKTSSKHRKCLSARRSPQKTKEKQARVQEFEITESVTTESNPADKDIEINSGCSPRSVPQTGLQEDMDRSKVNVSEHYPAPKRSSSRLKKKLQQQSTDIDAVDDKSDSSHISTNLADDETNQRLDSKSKQPNRKKSSKTNSNENKKCTQNNQNLKQESFKSEVTSSTQILSDPAESSSRADQKRKRNTSIVQPVNIKSVSKILPIPDDSGNTSRDVSFRKQDELIQVENRPMRKNSLQHSEGREDISHHVAATEQFVIPLLAAVQPIVRHSHQNVKENEKRRFKTFRKKLLDKSLEVQQNGLTLTSNFKPHGSGDKTKVCEGLDKYLMMQQVQQGRKSILDACLMVQRDAS